MKSLMQRREEIRCHKIFAPLRLCVRFTVFHLKNGMIENTISKITVDVGFHIQTILGPDLRAHE